MERFHKDGVVEKSINSQIKDILAGSMSSSIARVFGQPFDIIKVRFQLQQRASFAIQPSRRTSNIDGYHSIPNAAYQIYAEEGIKGFWRGHSTSQFQGLLQGMTIFWTFEQVCPILRSTKLATFPNLCNFTSGFITGAFVVIALSPLEVINTHVIARSADRKASGYQVAYELYKRHGGLRNFYLGGHAAVLHVGCLTGCKFMFYNLICNFIISMTNYESRENMPTPLLAMAGGMAGVSSHMLAYPMDLLKRRLQVRRSENTVSDSKGVSEKCVTLIQCLKLALRSDGFFGLYKGIAPCMIKSFVSTAVQFSAYDKFRRGLDNYL